MKHLLLRSLSFIFTCFSFTFTLVACAPVGSPSTLPIPLASQPAVATQTIPTVYSSLTTLSVIPSSEPSAIPTHSLESLSDKLPSVTPAHGFVVLEIPQSVPADGLITVTIFTSSGAECLIQYRGPNGLSHAAGLEPQIADANGICSWTWKQSMGNKLAEGTGRITITAYDEWETYDVVVVK
jgi:hypothetical protein